ncbi:hypothetical protein MIS45_02480 [Wielerella bovis]|uniref:hypothetical protein n=1 Tax=Wielerella bovis TaxID=2917790 RepID=UPI002018A924|nr:hypothetical protein [Wielerella bovis]ULJ69738.1 hypothetical protein MIS45_02480 [Wielerella bovis]
MGLMIIWARSWFFRQNRQIQGKNASQCCPLVSIFDAEVGDFDEKTTANELLLASIIRQPENHLNQ